MQGERRTLVVDLRYQPGNAQAGGHIGDTETDDDPKHDIDHDEPLAIPDQSMVACLWLI